MATEETQRGLDLTAELYASGAITPTSLAANQNDYNPTGLASVWAIRQATDTTTRTITGLTAPSRGGRQLALININAATAITLSNEDALSLAANRFSFGASVTLSAGQGIILWYDTTSSRWRLVIGATAPDRKIIDENFVNGATGQLTANVSGTGASVGATTPSTTDQWGVVLGTTGSTATGRFSVNSAVNAFALAGTYPIYCRADVNIPTLSNGTDTFTFRSGFGDSSSTEHTNGVFFRYTNGVNTGKFQAVTRSAGVETATDTGITVVAGTWYKLEYTVNAAGTSVVFKINGTVVATNTLTIPTGIAKPMGYYAVSVIKSLGIAAATSNLDYATVQAIGAG